MRCRLVDLGLPGAVCYLLTKLAAQEAAYARERACADARARYDAVTKAADARSAANDALLAANARISSLEEELLRVQQRAQGREEALHEVIARFKGLRDDVDTSQGQ